MEVGGRGVQQGAGRADADRAVDRARAGDLQRVAVHIAVVAQHVDHVAGAVLDHRRAVVDCLGRVVDRRHRNRDAGRGGAARAVADRIAERVAAVEVRLGRVAQRTAGVDADRAVLRTGAGHGQGFTVRVGVVRQHRDPVAAAVLEHRGAVVDRPRLVVDRGHQHPHRRRAGAARAVADRVGDVVVAVEVRDRAVGQRAAAIDGHAAVAGTGAGHPQCVAVDVAVVGQHSERAAGAVFRHRRRVVDRQRWIVDRGDADHDMGGVDAARPVADHIDDGVAAVEVGVRAVLQCAVGVDRYRAMAGPGAGDGQRLAIGVAVVAQYGDGVAGAVLAHRRRIVHRQR